MQPNQGTPEALLAAIAHSANESTQGWMRMLQNAAGPGAVPPWIEALQQGGERLARLQAEYAQKQVALWGALVSGSERHNVRSFSTTGPDVLISVLQATADHLTGQLSADEISDQRSRR